jgi:SGNH domain-containing protein
LIELGCGPSGYADWCHEYLLWAAEQVRALRPEVVVVGGQVRSGTDAARADTLSGMALVVDAMRPFAGRVIVVGDPPAQGQDPTQCLSHPGATMADCSQEVSDSQRSMYRQVREVARGHGATFLDTWKWFCYQGLCPMVVGQIVAYRDSSHITATYTFSLREPFRAWFDHAITA